MRVSLPSACQLGLVVLLTLGVVTCTQDTTASDLTFYHPPSPRLCVKLCKLHALVNTCKCPPKEAIIDRCLNKKCRRGSRCKAFGNRPVCIPIATGCLEPKIRGLCVGEFIRFYFNPRTNRCGPFIFGGCSPNRNNFHTLRSCQKACVAITG